MVDRRLIFFCEECLHLYKDGPPVHLRCEYCAGQYKKIRSLYTRIVRRRPHLAKFSVSQLFEHLYETLEKKEARKKK